MSRPAALSLLATGAARILGRGLSDTELQAFEKYLGLLQKWQRVQRLVGSVDPGWVVRSLFLDSLLFLHLLPERVQRVADVGSGAGFPGIPIKIVRPRLALTLIESRERRASFLSTVIREIGLDGIQVRNTRAEELADESPHAFDAVVLRCAGDPTDVLPVTLRLVGPGGRIVMAGPPQTRPLPGIEWVEVPGSTPGSRRLFGVAAAQ
jgi:16S rRNA (guanine527-N7)-methyltransferase